MSDTIYPIMQLVLPYVRDAKNLLNVFKSLGYSNNKVHVIVNRYDKSSKLKLTDLSGAINAAITVPNEYTAVTDSVNQGISVYKLYKTSAVTKSLIGLAESITKTQVEEKGLLSRMFGS